MDGADIVFGIAAAGTLAIWAIDRVMLLWARSRR